MPSLQRGHVLYLSGQQCSRCEETVYVQAHRFLRHNTRVRTATHCLSSDSIARRKWRVNPISSSYDYRYGHYIPSDTARRFTLRCTCGANAVNARCRFCHTPWTPTERQRVRPGSPSITLIHHL
eukprot:PhF_6_TR31818/c0_g1_i4/m.47010